MGILARGLENCIHSPLSEGLFLPFYSKLFCLFLSSVILRSGFCLPFRYGSFCLFPPAS